MSDQYLRQEVSRPRWPALLLILLGILTTSLLSSCFQPDQVFLVDSLVDGPDFLPGDGNCEMAEPTPSTTTSTPPTSGPSTTTSPPPSSSTSPPASTSTTAIPTTSTTSPSGPSGCSLRAAVMEASASGLRTDIVLPSGVLALNAAGNDEDLGVVGDLDVHADIRITGNGTTVDLNGLFDRAFDVHGKLLILEDLTLLGAETPNDGGAVLVRADGQLNANRTTMEENVAASGAGILDIEPGGVAIVRDSTLTSSTGPEAGAIRNAGELTVVNSTISGNGDPAGASVPAVVDLLGASTLLQFTTISENHGGGLVTDGVTTILAGTAVVDSFAGPDCAGAPVSAGYNLDSDGSCGLVGVGDLSGVVPLLGPLADNGGDHLTHLPYLNSPLVDSVPASYCSVAKDQRGITRPDGADCDIGAVEGNNGLTVTPLDLTVDTASDLVDVVPGDGVCDTGVGTCSLRAAIAEANASPTLDTITLSVDPVIEIGGRYEDENSTGDLDIADRLVLDGGGYVLDANGRDRALEIHRHSVSVQDLTIVNGGTEDGGAMRINSPGQADLTGMVFANNESYSDGGAVLNSGTMSVAGSVFADNEADDFGGGLLNEGLATVSGVTFSGNDGWGDGVRNHGSLTITDSNFLANNGTGLDNAGIGDVTVHRSRFSGHPNAAVSNQGTAVVTSSTFDDNRWGISSSGDLSLFDSTISANLFAVDIGSGSNASIVHSTIRHNFRGLYSPPSATVTVAATLFDNLGLDCLETPTSLGYNLDSDGSCGLTATGDGSDLPGYVGLLADNGGPTPTHLARANSPGIDRIPAGTPSLCDTSTTTDQRGFPRPVGSGCDIGAVEGHDGVSISPLNLTVDTGTDAPDASPGDGVCDTGTGACSLRAAVEESNIWQTADIITLATDAALTILGEDEDLNVTGDLNIYDELVIDGAGHTIDVAGVDRGILVGMGPVAITDLNFVDADRAFVNHGIISVEADAELTIDTVVFTTGHSDRSGGAIENLGVLTVLDSLFSGSRARDHGGAVYNSGTATISGSTFDGNDAWENLGRGGGIYNSGTLSLTSSTFTGNTSATTGGGIHNEGFLVVDDVDLESNAAATDGGGLYNEASLPTMATIANSRVTANSASTGGGLANAGDLEVLATTFTGNQATQRGGAIQTTGPLTVSGADVGSNVAADGAGISVWGATVSLSESSIHNNVAFDEGGGLFGYSGAAVDIVNVTVAQNQADEGAAVHLSGGSSVSASFLTATWNFTDVGGSIHLDDGASSVTFAGTLLDNPDPNCSGTGSFSSTGYSVSSDGSCSLTHPTDAPSTAPLEDTLMDNGGSSGPSNLLYLNSPALDSIPFGTLGLCDGTISTDQRGFARPDGPTTDCDIGSVEGDNGLLMTPLVLTVDDAGDAPDAAPGDGFCDDGLGSCTLRAAIDEINARQVGAIVHLTVDPVLTLAGVGEDMNSSGDLDLYRDAVLDGAGHTVNGAALDRIFDLHGALLSIDDVTLTGGSASTGGAVNVDSSSSLLLDGSVVTANTGGAIRVEGSATITDSLISANVSSSAGSGVWGSSNSDLTIDRSTFLSNSTTGSGGAILTDGPLEVSNSTFINNHAGADGGALLLHAGSEAHISNSTIVGNQAESRGGAIRSWGHLELTSSTVTGNSAPNTGGLIGTGTGTIQGTILDNSGNNCSLSAMTSGGYNAIGDLSCTFAIASDIVAVDPELGFVGDNGGPTSTRLPHATSPTVDAIPGGTPDICDGTIGTDQRGVARPVGGPCDIGAVEGSASSAPLDLLVDTGTDSPDVSPGDGVCDAGAGTCTLRAAIDEANAWPAADTITLGVDVTLSVAGPDDDLNASGDLDVLDSLWILGAGHTVDAAGVDRHFDAQAGSLGLSDLSLLGGVAEEGGSVRNLARLAISRSRLSGNASQSTGATQGGAIFDIGISLDISESTFDDNRAVGQGSEGGAIYTSTGVVTIRSSTFYNNRISGLFGVGGAIAGDSATITIVRSTFVENRAAYGRTIRRDGGSVTMQGSILLLAPGGTSCDGNFTSLGYNWLHGSTCGSIATGTDIVGTDPLLGLLQDNGGPTPTMLPQPGSPLLDAIPWGSPGVCDAVDSDQRGLPRPATVATGCDPGAAERQPGE